MKILFANFPADGHFNPLTGLAVCLRQQVHDVRWYTSQAYAGKLQQLRIAGAAVGAGTGAVIDHKKKQQQQQQQSNQ